jgi:hypothetical protein
LIDDQDSMGRGAERERRKQKTEDNWQNSDGLYPLTFSLFPSHQGGDPWNKKEDGDAGGSIKNTWKNLPTPPPERQYLPSHNFFCSLCQVIRN